MTGRPGALAFNPELHSIVMFNRPKANWAIDVGHKPWATLAGGRQDLNL